MLPKSEIHLVAAILARKDLWKRGGETAIAKDFGINRKVVRDIKARKGRRWERFQEGLAYSKEFLEIVKFEKERGHENLGY